MKQLVCAELRGSERKEWDLNPRKRGCPFTPLAGERDKPDSAILPVVMSLASESEP